MLLSFKLDRTKKCSSSVLPAHKNVILNLDATHGARQSLLCLLKRIHNVMSTIPFSLGNVNASQAEKLNRLQKVFAGQASGNIGKLTPEILKMLKNKMESNGINVASILPGPIQEHPDDMVKIAEEIATAGSEGTVCCTVVGKKFKIT